MQRCFVWLPSLLVVVFGITLSGQANMTMEEHAKAMKANAAAAGALGKAFASGAVADARTQVAALRKNYMALQAFWMAKKKDDALAIVKDGLARLDAMDKLLAAPALDQTAGQAAVKEFQGNTCGACHKLYREGDAQSGFRFKAGVL